MNKRRLLFLLFIIIGLVGLVGLLATFKRRAVHVTVDAEYTVTRQQKFEGDGKARYVEEGYTIYTFKNTGDADMTLHMPPARVVLDNKGAQYEPDALLERFDPQGRDIVITPGEVYTEQVDYTATFLSSALPIDETLYLKIDGKLQACPVTPSRKVTLTQASQTGKKKRAG